MPSFKLLFHSLNALTKKHRSVPHIVHLNAGYHSNQISSRLAPHQKSISILFSTTPPSFKLSSRFSRILVCLWTSRLSEAKIVALSQYKNMIYNLFCISYSPVFATYQDEDFGISRCLASSSCCL